MLLAVWVWVDYIFSSGTCWWCNVPQSNCHWHNAIAEQSKQFTAWSQVWYEISSSAVLTDFDPIGEKADEATCRGSAGIVLGGQMLVHMLMSVASVWLWSGEPEVRLGSSCFRAGTDIAVTLQAPSPLFGDFSYPAQQGCTVAMLIHPDESTGMRAQMH